MNAEAKATMRVITAERHFFLELSELEVRDGTTDDLLRSGWDVDCRRCMENLGRALPEREARELVAEALVGADLHNCRTEP